VVRSCARRYAGSGRSARSAAYKSAQTPIGIVIWLLGERIPCGCRYDGTITHNFDRLEINDHSLSDHKATQIGQRKAIEEALEHIDGDFTQNT
jgi:hypothetical protein